MKQTVYNTDFHRAFFDADRENQFSYTARNIIFDYLEQLEEDMGEEIELDVITLCCDYTEETAEEVIQCFDLDVSDCMTDDEEVDFVREYLADNTTIVGEFNGTFVYLNF